MQAGNTWLVARREIAWLVRSRAGWGLVTLLAIVAWLPSLLTPLRSGAIGLPPLADVVPLTMALGAVLLPIVCLLAGADLFAGELEDRTLVPILVLPISRSACFAGKLLGRGALLAAAYGTAFGGVAVVTAALRGSDGLADHLAVVGAGALLGLSCFGLGVALGVTRGGRVRAFGASLLAWVLLVFVVDTVLLAAILTSAPPPPREVGAHGHAELRASPPQRSVPWLMALDPVDLARLLAVESSPRIRARMTAAGAGVEPPPALLPLATGWTLWLTGPVLVAWRRFRRHALV